MTNDVNYTQDHASDCSGKFRNFGQNLMFLMIGGGIGAALALLLAPKSGREMRADIAELASKGYEGTVNAANLLKAEAGEYYATAREAGGEVLDVVTTRASAVAKEVRSDAHLIREIVDNAGKRGSHGSELIA